MDDLKVRMSGIPLGVLSALIVTAMLFVALPLLTQFQHANKQQKRSQSILISSRRPPPPPAEDRDQPRQQEMKKAENQKKVKQTQRTQVKFEAPHVSLASGGSGVGGIKIGMVSDFKISDSLFMSAFNLNEVDQPPRAVRTFPPQYPFIAKRDNITGRVVLRFVVDVDGNAKEAEVAQSEPEGVFDEAALKALERYKFKPAIKGGKPVNCIVKLPIAFTMD